MSDEFNAPELMGFPKYLQQKGTGWHCQAVPYRAQKCSTCLILNADSNASNQMQVARNFFG